MTVTFFEREPDRVQIMGGHHHQHYVFQFYEPGKGDQIGAYMVSVTSPHDNQEHWRAIKFYRAGEAAYQVVAERNLTAHETELFEQRVKIFQQAGTD